MARLRRVKVPTTSRDDGPTLPRGDGGRAAGVRAYVYHLSRRHGRRQEAAVLSHLPFPVRSGSIFPPAHLDIPNPGVLSCREDHNPAFRPFVP